ASRSFCTALRATQQLHCLWARGLIAARSHLRICETQVAVASRDSSDRFEFTLGCHRQPFPAYTPFDPMVRHLFVRYVIRRGPGHMAGRTGRILRVVLLGKSRLIVALQAALPIERDLFVGCWRAMRIVAGGAGHAIARLLLAFTAQQRFPLARSSPTRPVFVLVDKKQCRIEEIVSRNEVLQSFPFTNHCGLTLQMAAKAHRVTPNRLKTADLENVRDAARRDVRLSVAMARCAGNSTRGKRFAGKTV